jgi:hypothetical protein
MNLLVRLISGSLNLLKNIYKFSDAVLSGFWLGIMSEKTIDRYNSFHYDHSTKYLEDTYNLSGLHKWEYDRIKKYFSSARTFMLIGAGGGRETAALRKWGVDVDSYECSEKFVVSGNDFLKRNNIDATICWLPVNSVPDVIKKYDGIILGWGAYTHIHGSWNRISLLKKLHPFCKNETQIMISFFTTGGLGRKDKIISRVSNFLRFFSQRPKTEPGDRLESYFAHYFNREEIESELMKAGFRMTEYYDDEYGCAVGVYAATGVRLTT